MSTGIRLFVVFLAVMAIMTLGIGMVFQRAADQALAKCTTVEQTLGECK